MYKFRKKNIRTKNKGYIYIHIYLEKGEQSLEGQIASKLKVMKWGLAKLATKNHEGK